MLVSRAAMADNTVKRHVVFDFTVGVVSDQHTKDSSVKYGIPNAAGISPVLHGTGDNSDKSNVSDKGQITVDYQGIEADGGLVVQVSEAARTNRTSAPATCIIYPDTNVACVNGNVYPEEITTLRTLSPKFFNPAALDVHRHWKVNAPSAGVAIDFSAVPQGSQSMHIQSQRNEESRSGDATNATASYTYEVERCIPTALKEYTTVRQEIGPGQYANITIDVTATLNSDSTDVKS